MPQPKPGPKVSEVAVTGSVCSKISPAPDMSCERYTEKWVVKPRSLPAGNVHVSVPEMSQLSPRTTPVSTMSRSTFAGAERERS